MKIKIIQYYYSDNLEYVKQSEEINRKYCEKYDIDYYCEKNSKLIFDTVGDRNPSWYKIRYLKEQLESFNHDYIIYLDADAFIANHDIDIRDVIKHHGLKHNLIIGQDFGPDLVNGGVLIFKNTNWSKDFLERVWNKSENISRGRYKTEIWLEQTILSTFLLINDHDAAKAKIVGYNNYGAINSIHLDKNTFIYHDLSKERVSEYYKIHYGEGVDMYTHLKLTTTSDRHVGHGYFDYYIPMIQKYNNDGRIPTIVDVGSGDNGMTFQCLLETTDLKINYICLSNKENTCPGVKRYDYSPLSEEDIDNFIKTNTEDIDVIIDDSTHKSDERHFLFYKLFSLIKSGGMYIVEDLQTDHEIRTPANDRWNWGNPEKVSFVDMLQEYKLKKTFTSDYQDLSIIQHEIQDAYIHKTERGSELGVVNKK